jgi:O-acetyl-ADP-ribose deacetylase (regulator of RNase III)
LAIQNNLRSVAFPAISTGAFGYPIKAATTIAISTVNFFTRQNGALDEVVFCCFSGEDLAVYNRLLQTQTN